MDPRARARAETDRVLALLDNATQRTMPPTQSHDPFVGLYDDREACWRCEAPATTDLGVCDGCLEALRSEDTGPRQFMTTMAELLNEYAQALEHDNELRRLWDCSGFLDYSPPWAGAASGESSARQPHERPFGLWPSEAGFRPLQFSPPLPLDAETSPALGIVQWTDDGRCRTLRPPMLIGAMAKWGRCTIADHELPLGQEVGACCHVPQWRTVGFLLTDVDFDSVLAIRYESSLESPLDGIGIRLPAGGGHNWLHERLEAFAAQRRRLPAAGEGEDDQPS